MARAMGSEQNGISPGRGVRTTPGRTGALGRLSNDKLPGARDVEIRF